jgi:hypothetical protein
LNISNPCMPYNGFGIIEEVSMKKGAFGKGKN